jgi:hypothetical protein
MLMLVAYWFQVAAVGRLGLGRRLPLKARKVNTSSVGASVGSPERLLLVNGFLCFSGAEQQGIKSARLE